ncbi:hypothetical protein ILUMI_27383 [Ignelater luminosus]|uniref:Uncharacterized protein n=1 Tax=Ignelater luminosus TaxID=2038154 RepID=A0A8K0C3K2_IGNLU|nr:hypothetical protein ILUMI_27383 [Ignelater luminosus]
MLENEIQTQKERYAESNVDEDNQEPCSSQANCNKLHEDNELAKNVPKTQLFAREAFLTQDRLLGDLKILLVKFDENVKILEDEIDSRQNEARNQPEESTEDEQPRSEYESDEEIQVSKSQYAVQYSVRNRRRNSEEFIDDYGSQVQSSNETLTFFNREFVEQGWPIFQDCIGCFWSNYCASSDQQNYTETYSRTRNRSRNVQRDMEEERNPNMVKRRSGSMKNRKHKPNTIKEDISNQSHTQDNITNTNEKRGKSKSSGKPKQLRANNKDAKTKKDKNKKGTNKNSAKKLKNTNKTKNKS